MEMLHEYSNCISKIYVLSTVEMISKSCVTSKRGTSVTGCSSSGNYLSYYDRLASSPGFPASPVATWKKAESMVCEATWVTS